MDHRTYGAYGYRVAITVDMARTGYAGEVAEVPLGGYHLGHRLFVPWLRRFISPDAVSPFGAGGLNRYGYCAGDPINRVDPSGQASFGWLGKLLGQLAGAFGNAARAVSGVTPTVALGALSRTAEVITVSVGIGAVAAAALDDTETAGILGWIAAGSGLAAAGLGVAGQAIGKAGRTGKAQAIANRSEANQRTTRTAESSNLLYGGTRQLEEVNATHTDATGFQVHEVRTAEFPRAEWILRTHPNNAASIHLVADSAIMMPETREPLDQLQRMFGPDPVTQVTYYGGGHGDRHGMNRQANGSWASPAPGGLDHVIQNRSSYLAWMPIGSSVDTFDVTHHSASTYRARMRQTGFHIHYYCYSAISQDVVAELALTGYRHVPIAGPLMLYSGVRWEGI